MHAFGHSLIWDALRRNTEEDQAQGEQCALSTLDVQG